MRWETNEGGIRFTNTSILVLLMNAYGLREDQVTGLPHWADSMRFDVVAKITEPDLVALPKMSVERRNTMLQKLIIQRFGLRSHIITRTSRIYELHSVSGQTKLQKSAITLVPGQGSNGVFILNHGDLKADAMTLPMLAKNLSGILSCSVVNKTGIEGFFQVHLHWTPDDSAADVSNSSEVVSSPSIYTAVKEQLGLRLQPAKGPVDVFVVDQLEMPSAN